MRSALSGRKRNAGEDVNRGQKIGHLQIASIVVRKYPERRFHESHEAPRQFGHFFDSEGKLERITGREPSIGQEPLRNPRQQIPLWYLPG